MQTRFYDLSKEAYTRAHVQRRRCAHLVVGVEEKGVGPVDLAPRQPAAHLEHGAARDRQEELPLPRHRLLRPHTTRSSVLHAGGRSMIRITASRGGLCPLSIS